MFLGSLAEAEATVGGTSGFWAQCLERSGAVLGKFYYNDNKEPPK